MRLFILFLCFTGIILVVANELINRTPPRVEYRYLPRDLDMYLRELSLATVPYEGMLKRVGPGEDR